LFRVVLLASADEFSYDVLSRRVRLRPLKGQWFALRLPMTRVQPLEREIEELREISREIINNYVDLAVSPRTAAEEVDSMNGRTGD
jgi:hypothetical protein